MDSRTLINRLLFNKKLISARFVVDTSQEMFAYKKTNKKPNLGDRFLIF